MQEELDILDEHIDLIIINILMQKQIFHKIVLLSFNKLNYLYLIKLLLDIDGVVHGMKCIIDLTYIKVNTLLRSLLKL